MRTILLHGRSKNDKEYYLGVFEFSATGERKGFNNELGYNSYANIGNRAIVIKYKI